MASGMQITYLRHSGFAVRTSQTLLVFDDAQGVPGRDDSLANGHVTRALIQTHPQTLYFISHAHADHFDPAVYDFADAGNVQYILGHDVPLPHPGHRMRCGDTLTLGGVDITAYDSTDEGVSFLVSLDGWTLFHAGDLNLWHWREESTVREIEAAEQAFFQAVEPLRGQAIDFAFFPLDPRMGEMYDAGAVYFLMHIQPRVMLPMHWWDRDDVPEDFARRNRSKRVEIVALTTPGETIRAQKQADGGLIIDM